MSFNSEFEFQKRFLPQILDILKQNTMYLVSIEVAPEYDDCHHATDLVLKLNGVGSIAVRVRRWILNNRTKKPYRDFTIRSKTKYNNRTELDKLRDGFARWYLYCWLDKYNKYITSYVLLDLDLMRHWKAFHESYSITSNFDGTEFIAIPINTLSELDNNIIISHLNDGYLDISV